ncbi:glycosyltransferase [Pseudogemmobacter sonorensis]|uniref:glycosyltransferase n=1 Tax=Pseudogemmobacter sonorensis TaxID=2989681 RepID=UPI0036941697
MSEIGAEKTGTEKTCTEKTCMGTEPVAVMTTLYRKDPLHHFELAIGSIEAQDIAAERRIYLCVDGPLPETHESWLAANAHRFHRILRNDSNIGLARSLNRLIDLLEDEELVFRMDGDDISLPSRFRKQAEMLRADPSLGLIGCQVVDIDDDGSPLQPRTYPTDAGQVRAMLTRANPILHPTFCFRRSVLREAKLRYPDAYLCEDLALLILVARRGIGLSNHPETLFQWRTGGNFFARRRDFRRGWTEMRWYLAALRDQGRLLSPGLVYPFARFAMRCMPLWMIRCLYRSGLRNRTLEIRG